MIRLLLLFLFGFLIYTLFSAIMRSLPRGGTRSPQSGPEGEEMVRDPECGTYIPRSDALTATVRGTRHYFCSPGCREAFRGRK